MKIEINEAYKNLRLLSEEVSGRSRTQRRLEAVWIAISAILISALFLSMIFLAVCSDWNTPSMPRSVAWEEPSHIKKLPLTIDEGWVVDENAKYIKPKEEEYERN